MTTVATYLLDRLVALGITHLFGVPGDFNLALVSAIDAHPSIKWMYACLPKKQERA
jgi:TPP-dependent 2-oxoacid decarboxylase